MAGSLGSAVLGPAVSGGPPNASSADLGMAKCCVNEGFRGARKTARKARALPISSLHFKPGQVHQTGTNTVEHETFFAQRVKNEPPREIFDPPRADARLLEIVSFAPKLRMRLKQFNGMPHRVMPPLGHFLAGVCQ